MKKLVLIAVSVFFSLSAAAYAEKLDLSSWSVVNYPVQSQPDGNWILSNNNTTVTQTMNVDPSIYLNNLNQTAYVMEGTWQVKTSGDDDFMGFVFGYQDETHFYLMDWKQRGQFSSGYGTAEEGFTIKKIAAASKADLTAEDFWSSTDTDNMTILATNYGEGNGWADNTLYKFTLTFTNTGFSITVEDESGTTTLWDVSVSDTSYTYGQFGFYNFSQSSVEYNGFTQTGGEIVTPGDPSSGCTQAELDAKYAEGFRDGLAQGAAITINPDLSFKLDNAVFNSVLGTNDIWVEFEFYDTRNGKLLWELVDFGIK